MSFSRRLVDLLGADRVRANAPLAPLTTFRVGGPADWLAEVRSADETLAVLRLAQQEGVPVTLMGGGSNVLVSDRGLRGLVLRVHGGRTVALEEADSREPAAVRVRADAGVTINGLVRWTINRGVSGLEAWAGTPGTVGGAVSGNAHFQGRNIGELVAAARLSTLAGEVRDVPASDLDFSYDSSRLKRTGEALLSAVFRLGSGEPATLRRVARASLAYRKQTQPLDAPSAGCVFQNPQPAWDRLPDGVPWSAGALIDRSGLKGVREGGAQVSATHGNFIVNTGGATASDIRRLVERCRRTVAKRFGVTLREEIVYLGEF